MIFTKDLNKNFNKKDDEDLTEKDFLEINKDISKALNQMKEEKSLTEENSDIEDEEKESLNFEMDFFSQNNSGTGSTGSMNYIIDNSEKEFRNNDIEHFKNIILENNFKNNSNYIYQNNINYEDKGFYKDLNYKYAIFNNSNIYNNNLFSESILEQQNINIEKKYLKENNNNFKYSIQVNNNNLQFSNDNFKFQNNNLNNNNFINFNSNNNKNVKSFVNNCINDSIANYYYLNNNNLHNNCINNNIELSNKYNNKTDNIIKNYNITLINNNLNNIYFQNSSTNKKQKKKIFNESPKNLINIEKIIKGKDKRTTLIIRNIPNQYTISHLLKELNKNLIHKFNILFLPKDKLICSNLGYGFINFINHMHLIQFYDTYHDKKWNLFNSNKKCQLAYSKYQDKKGLIKYICKKMDINENILANNKEDNLRNSIFIDNNCNYRVPIEIPLKYYNLFRRNYPFAKCKYQKNETFVVENF